MKPCLRSIVATFLCLTCWPLFAFGAKLSADAQRHFDAGIAYVDDPSGSKWEEAFKEFRAAYAASPNWKLMNNIGLCALNMERDGEAIEAYKEYLAHGGEDDFTPKQRKQMERDVAMLTASLVRVSLETEPMEAMLIDERRNAKGAIVVNQYSIKGGRVSLGIHPGLHKFILQAPGFITAEWSLDAEPSSTHQHQFKLESRHPQQAGQPTARPVLPDEATSSAAALEPTSSGTRTTPSSVYVGLASAGVFAVGSAVFGVLELAKQSDFDNAKERGDRRSAERAADAGKELALACDISLGGALVSAGVTTYLWLSAPSKPPVRASGSRAVHVSPLVGRGEVGLRISNSF